MNKLNHICLQGTYNIVWKRRLTHKHIAYVYTHKERIKLQQRKIIRYSGKSYGNPKETVYKIKYLYSSKMSMLETTKVPCEQMTG